MTWLLDTNAVSDLMRSRPATENWIDVLDPADRVVICTVVRGEILFGVARLPVGRRRAELAAKALKFLAAFPCEPIPEGAGDRYAEVKSIRRKKGLTLDENDLWIAATALTLGATLVSRDGDFDGIDGLRLHKVQ